MSVEPELYTNTYNLLKMIDSHVLIHMKKDGTVNTMRDKCWRIMFPIMVLVVISLAMDAIRIIRSIDSCSSKVQESAKLLDLPPHRAE